MLRGLGVGGVAVRGAGAAAPTDAARRRIGFRSRERSGDRDTNRSIADGLQKLGGTEGVNLQIDYLQRVRGGGAAVGMGEAGKLAAGHGWRPLIHVKVESAMMSISTQ